MIPMQKARPHGRLPRVVFVFNSEGSSKTSTYSFNASVKAGIYDDFAMDFKEISDRTLRIFDKDYGAVDTNNCSKNEEGQ